MFQYTSTTSLTMGDAFALIKEVPDSSVDLILTDPPYNIGSYSTGNIKFTTRKEMNNDIAHWDQDMIDPTLLVPEFQRILKPTGNIFIFTGSNLFGRWHSLLDPVYDTFQFMAWHKTNPTPNVRKSSFLNSIELIVCAWNKGHTWNFTKQNEMHNFLESGVCQGKERTAHPTQKPVKILEKLVSIASNPGDVVFDPFMGSGSTGVASTNLGRNFIGFELSPEYYAIANDRMAHINPPAQ